MNLTPLLGMGMAVGLSACVATPAPQVPAQAGAFAVALEGGSYQAQIGPGRPGHALGRSGAVAVAGQTIRVTPFGLDQGRRAKAVAEAACMQARGRFQPQALGRFAQGAWIFEGGCA
ncbi:MAG: hypothetical protein LBE86_12475 [Gemmobacter sp.]|jgi:hypothetical protein|nr:hypothetical protein [Gemmobacter sp.]